MNGIKLTKSELDSICSSYHQTILKETQEKMNEFLETDKKQSSSISSKSSKNINSFLLQSLMK